ncbi:hypothetical protein WMY93_015115 [Mugilogobius chulae]|uniref:Uncharacterized protein n=1 Tax=Mugilogobius chulae TaxID=88201 RepID=A0AAW0P0V0_9GOBI
MRSASTTREMRRIAAMVSQNGTHYHTCHTSTVRNYTSLPPKKAANKTGQLDAVAERRTEANVSLPTPCPDDGAAVGNSGGKQVLDAIAFLKQELFDKIEEKAAQTQAELRNAIGKINKRLDDTETRTTDLENGVSAHSEMIAALESEVTTMKKDLATLKARCDNLEARSRRCNIRIT